MKPPSRTVASGGPLPPGQRRVDGFPRFGTHLDRPPPPIAADPVIEITGSLREPVRVPVAELATLPRRELTADFHCVAGWSATGLRWEGVAFETFYRTFIEAAVPPDQSITHVVFEGLDGYRSIVLLDDALVADVLLAEQLDGQPLDGDHGAPIRLVSPSQYGFVSTKHLHRIEVHCEEPTPNYHRSPRVQRGLQLVAPHPRARVWQEERHRYLPAWSVRLVYRALIPVLRARIARRIPRVGETR